jgi:hypothetical protein
MKRTLTDAIPDLLSDSGNASGSIDRFVGETR